MPGRDVPGGPPPAGGRPAPEPATCYRHPGREAGVRCTRCGRPICPECMVEASVGFQCPECVRAGNRSGRPVRTAFGGRPVRDPALVTKVLIGLNVAVFALVHVFGEPLLVQLVLLGRVPYQGDWIGVAAGQWYRLLTATFLHWEIWHIGLNMVSLWWIGPHVEQALGRLRYLALYLLSGLAGSALSFLVAGPADSSLGASGAIFGLLGATVVLHRARGYALGPIVALVVVNLILTFSISGVDWRAHIGGLAAGALTGAAMVHAPRRHRNLVQAVAVVTVLGAVVAMTAAGTVRIVG